MKDLEAFVALVRCPGWVFWVEDGNVVHVNHDTPQVDSRVPGNYLGDLGDKFVVHEDWTRQDVAYRLFCHLQFLTDHELREHFVIGDWRPLDPHPEPAITGQQHDWWVEHASALRGY